MTLTEELQRVREYLSGAAPPPSSEANTCSWIIRPLLHHVGYIYHEIDEQAHDGAGNIPDFTLLPDTPHTWFLEAKKWTVALADAHINQALNYANIQGKRWIVLSNGREWRLYDNYLNNVPPAERLVKAAKLDCGAELENLLGALSKEAVKSGALENYVNHARLTSLLDEQLKAPGSEVITAIRSVLKGKFGMAAVTPAAITAYFRARSTDSSPILPSAASAPAVVPLPAAPAMPPSAVIAGGRPAILAGSLSELLGAADAIQGRHPAALTFPDATVKPISSWRDMATGVVEWLFTKGRIPSMPFRPQQKGKRCFITNQPFPTSVEKMANKKIIVNGQAYYIHVNRSGPDFVRSLNALCKAVEESPEGFQVTFK